MSRKIGMDTICLRPTPRLAHTEYSLDYHKSLLAAMKGRVCDEWDFDVHWCIHDGPQD